MYEDFELGQICEIAKAYRQALRYYKSAGAERSAEKMRNQLGIVQRDELKLVSGSGYKFRR